MVSGLHVSPAPGQAMADIYMCGCSASRGSVTGPEARQEYEPGTVVRAALGGPALPGIGKGRLTETEALPQQRHSSKGSFTTQHPGAGGAGLGTILQKRFCESRDFAPM
jgi:hypothetical protein